MPIVREDSAGATCEPTDETLVEIDPHEFDWIDDLADNEPPDLVDEALL